MEIAAQLLAAAMLGLLGLVVLGTAKQVQLELTKVRSKLRDTSDQIDKTKQETGNKKRESKRLLEYAPQELAHEIREMLSQISRLTKNTKKSKASVDRSIVSYNRTTEDLEKKGIVIGDTIIDHGQLDRHVVDILIKYGYRTPAEGETPQSTPPLRRRPPNPAGEIKRDTLKGGIQGREIEEDLTTEINNKVSAADTPPASRDDVAALTPLKERVSTAFKNTFRDHQKEFGSTKSRQRPSPTRHTRGS